MSQTVRGASIDLVPNGRVPVDELAAGLAADLTRLGLPHPDVRVQVVERLPLQASGKLMRFIANPQRDLAEPDPSRGATAATPREKAVDRG